MVSTLLTFIEVFCFNWRNYEIVYAKTIFQGGNKMNKRKMIYIIIITLIISVVTVYYLLNGNPYSKLKAKGTLETYLAETYPDETFYISKRCYDPEFSDYLFDVIKEDDPTQKEYRFEVPTILSEYELVDGIFNANLDESLGDKFEQEAIIEIKKLLKNSIPEIRELEVYIYVLQGKYDNNKTWDKNLQMDKPMDVHMIIDGTDLSKQEVLEVAKTIQNKFNVEGYDYKSVAVNVYVPFKNEWLDEWIVKYMIEFNQSDKINEDDIEEHNMEFLGE